jgi:hypothetical protein
VNAVETQPDVGRLAAGVEHVAREPHDRRHGLDAQPVAIATKPYFPG